MVFELMDKNLYELISDENSSLSMYQVKYIIYKVLQALNHMHKKGIFHRDIKPYDKFTQGEHTHPWREGNQAC